jgi:hypothetical protein
MTGSRERVLWERLAFLFDEDDGSLPDVRLVGLSDDAVERVATALQERDASGLEVSAGPGEIRLAHGAGHAWNPDSLAAFAVLLGDVRALDPAARLDLDEAIAPQFREQFVHAVDEYLAERSRAT